MTIGLDQDLSQFLGKENKGTRRERRRERRDTIQMSGEQQREKSPQGYRRDSDFKINRDREEQRERQRSRRPKPVPGSSKLRHSMT